MGLLVAEVMGRVSSGPDAPPLAAARRIASCRLQAEPVEAADLPVPSSTALAAQLPAQYKYPCRIRWSVEYCVTKRIH